MDLVISILNGEETRRLATFIFVAAVALDFILSSDRTPNNSIREWMLRFTQGSWLIFSGALMPYGLGILVGHFYHPPLAKTIFPLTGYENLITVIIIGVIISISSRTGFPKNKSLFYIAVFGMVVGAMVWPV